MVDTAFPTDRPARAAYTVERLTDREAIRRMLQPEGAYAAYALAQLAEPLFRQSAWWNASGPSGNALVLHARAGLGPALVTFGHATALNAVLALHPGPRSCFASFRPEHLQAVERHYVASRKALMVRMSVTADTFRPLEGRAVELRGRDVGAINRLYSTEGGPALYSPRHIDEATYCGVLSDGELVSIAGTHIDSPAERVALVGNVFTHPRYRGRGLASIATSAATRRLLQHCDIVALTVETGNAAALAVYEKLGYRRECTLYETPLLRRDVLGIVSGVRRLFAGLRGRREEGEDVVR